MKATESLRRRSSWLQWALRKQSRQQAKGRSGYPLHKNSAPTHRSSCILVSKCVKVLNLISMVPLPRRHQSIRWRCASSGCGVRSPSTSSGLKPGPPGSHEVFLCCPYDKAWCFCMNGDCFNHRYISCLIHIDLNGILKKT